MTQQDLPSSPPSGRVSIIIKALNEEKHIARAIESSLAALENIGGEVILADSCSTDRTIEIARNYPIKIVQLANPDERCCGIGPQLGYQHSCCEFVYILDGDMYLRSGFLEQAISCMATHPELAGVGGLVVEHNQDSLEYKSRVERAADHMKAGHVNRLDMGGLYRRQAIEQVGYLSDRNLHSYEEFDLAIRLRAAGWRLQRLAVDAVDHHGHDIPPYALLKRRWKSKYINGIGEVTRSAIGKAHFSLLGRELRELYIYLAFLGWMSIGVAIVIGAAKTLSTFHTFLLFLVISAMPPIALFMKKRSVEKATYAYASLALHAAALIRGFFAKKHAPYGRISSTLIAHNEVALELEH